MAKSNRRLGLPRVLNALLAAAFFWTLFCASFTPRTAQAQAARFDLLGPKVEVRVTRAGKTLPIAQVPNLQPGDKLWLHPNLPPTQSVHYLLIAAFLRGTTNPPPDEWFTKIETWNRNVREEGVTVTVPNDAQQAILFLAPETGGDFTTLKKAVRGRPGIFVRASQDLAEAGFEQARIEKYVASMRQVPPSDSQALSDHSTLLARTLNLKPNDECFKRSVDLQYNCLTQSGNQTLLDDGHAQSVIAQLSNGPNSDFITAASYTNVAGGGSYSAYVGAVVDLFRILGGLHSAQYQYIPAISFPENESLNLRLNTAPSFRNPKSVIVIGLPSIQTAVPPPLRPSDPQLVSCLLKPNEVLAIQGAPLVFSTNFAHDLVLHINAPEGTASAKDLPLVPDAYQGGLVIDRNAPRKPLPTPPDTPANGSAPPAAPTPEKTGPSPAPFTAPSSSVNITGTVQGFWGFDKFTGPTLQLQNQPGANWKLADDDPLIVGRENHVLLSASGTACVDSVRMETAPGTFVAAQWKPANIPNLLDVHLPLKSHDPGILQISIQQFGEPTAAIVNAKTFSEPATFTGLEFHAGDSYAVASGTNLFQVERLNLDTLTFTPDPQSPPEVSSNKSTSTETLRLNLSHPGEAPKFKAGNKLSASVTLKDGRVISLPILVAAARPSITLLSRNMGHPSDPTFHLTSEDDLPASQQLTFSLKSATPFLRTGKIEVASADEALHTELTVAAGSLILQNPYTLVATLDPVKAFGTSAFGPLRLRAITPDGVPGDWLPLATLVRLPTLSGLRCPIDPALPCTLSGTNLYLLDSVSTDPAFASPVKVPEGFVDTALSLPRPGQPLPPTASPTRPVPTTIYLHLRDDPTPTDSAVIPMVAVKAAPADSVAIPQSPATTP